MVTLVTLLPACSLAVTLQLLTANSKTSYLVKPCLHCHWGFDIVTPGKCCSHDLWHECAALRCQSVGVGWKSTTWV